MFQSLACYHNSLSRRRIQEIQFGTTFAPHTRAFGFPFHAAPLRALLPFRLRQKLETEHKAARQTGAVPKLLASRGRAAKTRAHRSRRLEYLHPATSQPLRSWPRVSLAAAALAATASR